MNWSKTLTNSNKFKIKARSQHAAANSGNMIKGLSGSVYLFTAGHFWPFHQWNFVFL